MELLVPVGNIEVFNAALEGGADAIYVGLQQFNARSRAKNFSIDQLKVMCDIAHAKGVKVYVTFNVVIKNSELKDAVDLLYQISQAGADAVIIQDWGVLALIKRMFPKLPVHASTQMANHNSLGSTYSDRKGIERVVMARELTHPELKTIADIKKTELEIFVHGALCYSFSGMCLFSSYLGGSGANRGACTQPCRRVFDDGTKANYTFSLKDNQLVELVPDMAKMGIDSLKLEGRMKSADYVYQVARAYRLAMDNSDAMDEALSMLKYDMGREKTSYFYQKDVATAITSTPNTGIFLGTVKEVTPDGFSFTSVEELVENSRLRVSARDGEEQITVKVDSFFKDGRNYSVKSRISGIERGAKVYLASVRIKRFSSKLDVDMLNRVRVDREYRGDAKFLDFKRGKQPSKERVLFRINNLDWLRKIHFDYIDGLIISLSKARWKEFRGDSAFLQKNLHKVWIELPKFISEQSIPYYRDLCAKMFKLGYKQFMISHLSQSLIIPAGAQFSTNENVYAYNDAAVAEIKRSGAVNFSYPVENDHENLSSMRSKDGFVSLYFRPSLFLSRMPSSA